MSKTIETKADVKNGVGRMIFAIISIVIEVVIILILLLYTGDKATWIYAVIRLMGAIFVLRIYGSHKTSSIRMTWMLIILSLPIFGAFFYLLIGLNGHSLRMRKRYIDVDRILMPMLPKNDDVADNVRNFDGRLSGLVEYIRRQAGFPVYQNTKIEYYDDADKGFEAQKRDLAKAEKFIFMEYHAIEDAGCWHELRDILAERVKAGVEVRVFYDDMGSLGFINTDFVKRTEEYGIQCRVFNPFAPGLNLFLNNRDHRKITVIDGKVGFTGGYNLAEEYFHRTEPFGFWKDTGVKLEGDAVQSLTIMFLEMWNAMPRKGKVDKDYEKYILASGVERLATKSSELFKQERKEIHSDMTKEYFDKMKEAMSEDERYISVKNSAEGKDLGFVQPYADSPLDDIHVGEDVYISMAESAQKYAWFITPYLIITDEMCHAFSLAAMRGVDIRIITPGVPDKKLVYSVTRSYYNGLARNGVRIYEFTPGFCHAKMSIVDDVMATCGTINLDYRSLYHHFENGCLYGNCQAVMDTKKDFEETFAKCQEVTQQYASGRGALLRFGQMLLRIAAPLM